MPFGVSPGPEEFQRRIDIALEGLPGQKAIADDILVFGAGDTDEEALKDHDLNLQEVFNCCRQKGIKLNAEKIQFRQKQVSYMGHIISSEGLQADPNKLKVINEMPPPTDFVYFVVLPKTVLIHHQKEWIAPLHSVSSRIEPVPHYPWLATCFSKKSFPMYTRICNKGKPSKRYPSTEVLKSCNP